ncbi:MAG TPA: FMN-binding negative transcriptional regulator [Casimicrobiaceae bacterium]|nr:FMN-binding negative transcriptional regulator [Casimicrobiaceae bacterium]
MSLYVPKMFNAEDRAAIARLMHDHPFATLITPGEPEPAISHVPLLLLADCEPHGTLIGHVARANPHWERMRAGESIAVFHGPHAYVSPSWYVDPANAVPTWNYAAVHARGSVELIHDATEARSILDALIQRFEGARAKPWSFAMPQRQRDAMVASIVAFRLRIKHLDAKFKLSQNRPREDRLRVIAALQAEQYPDAVATAAWMAAYANPQSAS